MLYLIAFFVSPLALVLAGKPIQGILNSFVYILAFFGLLLFVVPGVILWAIGVTHAVLVIHGKHTARRHSEMLAAVERSGANAKP